MIENRLLEYFLAIAREQNITRAAESLHITQPTLSKQMMDLEAQLGRQLLIRGKRKVTLTEDGRYLRARAQEIIDLVQKTESTFEEDADDVSGEVHLACGETRWMGSIANVMHCIMVEHPSVRFHLHSGDADTVLDRLDKGLADAGLLMGPLRDSRYEYFNLNLRDRYGLVVPRDSDLASKKTFDAAELPKLPLLFPEQTFQGHQDLDLLGLSYKDLNIVGVYNLFYNATHMVEHGMGYAFCLEGLVDEGTTRNLTFIPIEPETSIDLVMVTKRYQTFSPAVRLFLERLREGTEQARRRSPMEEGRESREANDVFFTCSLIDYIARKTKNRRRDVVHALGRERLQHIYELADVYHSDSIDRVSGDFIAEAGITQGDFDNVADARYAVPSHWDIGKVYKRLVLGIMERTGMDTVDALIAAYDSFVSDKIDDYNSSFYFDAPGNILNAWVTGKIE